MKPIFFLLLVAGCAASAPPPAALPTRDDPAFRCAAEPALGLIGRDASNALADEALRLTGARTIRWIQPGQAVTMDYREDRLNIALDAFNRVERITCG